MDAPLLEASRARIDAGGVAVVDGLTLRTSGERVLVLGAARALFEAASGLVPLTHGMLAVRGRSPLDGVRAGAVAGAPLDAPLPPDWSARTYVTWSARLAGAPAGASGGVTARVDDALARMELGAVADAKLARATPALRRATAIAAALATGASIVLLEDPLASLDDDAARHLARVTAAALEGRAWALFAPRVSLGSALTAAADEAIVVVGSDVGAQGAPRELAARDRRYALEVHGDAAALIAALEAHGATVDAPRAATTAPRRLSRIVVDLARDQTTRDLLAGAEAVGAVIVDLRPIARAFA
jgi:ABC-type multidrug transport system ATPase subunit